MNKRLCRVAVALFLAIASVAIGQNAREPDWKVDIKEIKMDRIKNADPGYRFPGVTPDQSSEWIRFIVTYDLSTGRSVFKPDEALWADSAEFDWSVILPREYNGTLNPKYSVRLHRTITYDAIREGTNNTAMLFIHPRTYERYRKDLSRDMAMLQVLVKIDGKTRAEGWARGRSVALVRADAGKLFPEFARTPVWFDWEEIPLASGTVSRMATPWAHSGVFFKIAKEEGN